MCLRLHPDRILPWQHKMRQKDKERKEGLSMTPYETATVLANALDSKKAAEIKVLRIEAITTIADYFVICTATSTTQIKALTAACEEAMEQRGETVHHIEGHRDGSWVLMDFSSVVVHIFMDEAREFYDLERLWADGEEVDLTAVLAEK